MNNCLYGYLKRKIISEFEASEWKDKLGIRFEDIFLSRIIQSLNQIENLQEDIMKFINQVNQEIKD